MTESAVLAIRPYALDINYRNHRKIVAIDGKVGYFGGMNIGINYKSGVKNKPWRDTHIRITGNAVHCLQQVFLSDWVTSIICDELLFFIVLIAYGRASAVTLIIPARKGKSFSYILQIRRYPSHG